MLGQFLTSRSLQSELFLKDRLSQWLKCLRHQIPYRFGIARLGIFAALAVAQDAIPEGIGFELFLPFYFIHLERVVPILSQETYAIGRGSFNLGCALSRLRFVLELLSVIKLRATPAERRKGYVKETCNDQGSNGLPSNEA